MYHNQPTKASPAGCMIGLFGFASLALSIIFGLGLYRVFTLEIMDWSLFWKYGLGSLGCLIIGLLIIRFGFKLALSADMSDPYSTTKSKIRF